MRNMNHKHYIYAIGAFLLAAITGLWSWNTLSELFSLPQAQFKHAVAAFLLLVLLRWTLFPSHRSGSKIK